MTKQIDFDPSLIGQPGISVKYRNGETPDFVKVYGSLTISIDKCGTKRNYNDEGKLFREDKECYDLIMYRELKEMTGEEWAKVSYPQSVYRDLVIIAFEAGKAHIKEIAHWLFD